MKIALFLAVFSLTLSAAWKPGSKCGLVDNTEDYKQVRTLNLDQPEREKIAVLPTLTKQQLIIAAKATAKDMHEEVEIKNSYDAALYLERGRGDLSVITATAGKTKVTEIRAYPGDNAYGFLFVRGTNRIVGLNSDDDIVCR